MSDHSELTLKEFSRANRYRCIGEFSHPIEDWSIADWAVAASGELGEACNLIKKLRRGTDKWAKGAYPGIEHDIALELADTVTYIDLLCTRLGYDLTDVLVEKFNIISERNGAEVRL